MFEEYSDAFSAETCSNAESPAVFEGSTAGDSSQSAGAPLQGAGGSPQSAGSKPQSADVPPQGEGGSPQGMGGPPQGIGGPPQGMGGPPQGMAVAPPGEDAVSGALNIAAFGRDFSITLSHRRLDQGALWYIDIKNFRSINPKYGFVAGNTVLHTLVDCFREFLCKELPVARLGADRFILLTESLDFEQATEAFHATIDALNDRIAQDNIFANIGLMGGIYYLRDVDFQNVDFNTAMDYASIAHRNARANNHSSLVMFTAEDLERDMRRITIEQTIDQALQEGQIEVWYQPQIDYTYGEVIGAEALARWHHPDLGWISPAEFIPVLENCGKIHDLDLFIWEEACRSAGRWRNAADGTPVPISVNISRAEMFTVGLMEHFLMLQEKYDLPPGGLRLEVTESAFVEEAERLYSVIENMRGNDLLVEMDDFGSGLSSLNMLKDVPVDVVKLDMGFVRSAMGEDRGGVVLSAVIRMLQGLDTPIIAEGVETLEQAELLKNMGCHLMQGFHFSRPMPLDEFEDYITSTNAVEDSARRTRKDSHLDELLSFDASSSYLFNNVMGGTMFFFAGNGTSESILVNDAFYEECGLLRSDFGNAKVNPIQEIDEESRATLWRAAADARENGGAMCRGKVRLTGRWIDCIMRYLGNSARGDIYSLNIFRSGSLSDLDTESATLQQSQDATWSFQLLDKVAPNGFVKCKTDVDLAIDYISPKLVDHMGFATDEFLRRFRNSFAQCVKRSDRHELTEAVRLALRTGESIEITCKLYQGFGGFVKARIVAHIDKDVQGETWLYALVILNNNDDDLLDESDLSREVIIPFDYLVEEDRLVVRDEQMDGSVREVVIEHWLERLDSLPDNISKGSAAKVLATVRDLRHHPASGFSDIKCNLRGGDTMRWYHVNYTCESDEEGNLTVLHGYAQDASDQMGSAKWWRRQAEIDHLTGLLNRNAVEQDINLAMRTQGSGLMFMIDLDGFKRVNDQLGHLVGDSLLRDVANVLSTHFREGDVLGRYGGDEFVAFVPVGASDAVHIAERRAKDMIRDIGNIPIPDGTTAACSVGVAVCNNRESTFYDLLEVADKAMYKSKLGGKGTFSVMDM